MALIRPIPSSGSKTLTISTFESKADDSSASGNHTANLTLTNIWTKLSVGGFTTVNGSAYISGDSTAVWTNATGAASDIDISSYSTITIHAQASGAFQAATISNIVLE